MPPGYRLDLVKLTGFLREGCVLQDLESSVGDEGVTASRSSKVGLWILSLVRDALRIV